MARLLARSYPGRGGVVGEYTGCQGASRAGGGWRGGVRGVGCLLLGTFGAGLPQVTGVLVQISNYDPTINWKVKSNSVLGKPVKDKVWWMCKLCVLLTVRCQGTLKQALIQICECVMNRQPNEEEPVFLCTHRHIQRDLPLTPRIL